jgi:uncharacterized protein with PIN domain
MNRLCWICLSVDTSENPIITVEKEELCTECKEELSTISREMMEKRHLKFLGRGL